MAAQAMIRSTAALAMILFSAERVSTQSAAAPERIHSSAGMGMIL